MIIYIDVDDTLANFRDHAIDMGVPPWTGTWYAADPKTWTPEQHHIQAKTNELMGDPRFWATIPTLGGASELLVQAENLAGVENVKLLTAYPRTCPDKEMVKREKIAWSHHMLGVLEHRVLVVERPMKIHYAQRPETGATDWGGPIPIGRSNILIDDAQQNCDEWAAAGGIAILYNRDDWQGAITQMQQAYRR